MLVCPLFLLQCYIECYSKLYFSLLLFSLSFIEVKEVFTLFDKDNDGFINPEELGNVMRALGQNPTEAEVHMLTHDNSEDG